MTGATPYPMQAKRRVDAYSRCRSDSVRSSGCVMTSLLALRGSGDGKLDSIGVIEHQLGRLILE
jgi:hypothetical protein